MLSKIVKSGLRFWLVNWYSYAWVYLYISDGRHLLWLMRQKAEQSIVDRVRNCKCPSISIFFLYTHITSPGWLRIFTDTVKNTLHTWSCFSNFFRLANIMIPISRITLYTFPKESWYGTALGSGCWLRQLHNYHAMLLVWALQPVLIATSFGEPMEHQKHPVC